MSAASSGPSSLRRRIARAEGRRRGQAVVLMAPLVLFLLLTFLIPIGDMLWRSVDDRALAPVLPRTLAALEDWGGTALPGDDAFAALAADLVQAREERTIAVAARRLNDDTSGFRSLVMNTARGLEPGADPKAALLAADPRWGEVETWGAIQRSRGPVTDFYLLRAIDLERAADGGIRNVPADQAVYQAVFARTFWVALIVTVACLVLGFPVAQVLARQSQPVANLLLILVLLPFWISLLVRTAAWVVLLQRNGVINDTLLSLGVTDQPAQLIYNRTGVVVAMTHVLLPYMILPLYAAMRAVPAGYLRAAASLGAPPVTVFRRIFLPLVLPGIGAGTLLVFILALGFYITPALVGGAADQMVSYFVSFYTTNTVNWGMAAALGTVLLLVTLLLYLVYARVIGARRLGLG